MNTEDFKEVVVHGATYKTKLTKNYENRKKWEAPNPNNLLAYLPGTIVDIFVEEGQKIKSGEHLLVLEAMKMKNLICAPKDGIVKKINVKLGESVPKNFVIAEVE